MEYTDKELREKIAFLQEEINIHIEKFSKKRKDNKYKARNFHVVITIASAISTVILGFDFAGFDAITFISNQTKNIALMISSFITVISTYNTFFDHKSLWVNYTNTRNRLFDLRFDINFYLKGKEKIDPEEIEAFKERYRDILHMLNEKWSKLRG
ncbi:DUF4231 domain-containing protein [Tenacibaculum amylolyticum]|uniref:DUF4231 domain-containing protein n=1 Tax=Tenacibaculum amylolyticum TaxID=104269 RepID=UPI00389434A4